MPKWEEEIGKLIDECSKQNQALGGGEILMGSGRELHLKLENLLAQREQEVREMERKSWHSPFDGLEIKLMYRDGDKVLQNKHIFSLEQISFIKGLFDVAQLKFNYMLKDLLAEALSPLKDKQDDR